MNLRNFKKMTLVAAVAATVSMSSFADIDMDVATDESLKYATELQGTLTAGKVAIAKKTTITDIQGTASFGATGATTRYIRFDLTNATFNGNPASFKQKSKADDSVLVTGVLENGGDGESYAIYKQVSAENITAGQQWDLVVGTGYKVDPTATVTVTYAQYETATNAANQTSALVSKSKDMIKFVAGADYTAIIEASPVVATVASNFQTFNNAANISTATNASGKTALAFLDLGDVISATPPLKLDGSASAKEDYITQAQTITVTGDVSLGVFTSETAAACDGTGAIACTANTAKTACTITATDADNDAYICLNTSGLTAGQAISKGAYTLSYEDEAVSGALGSIAYDTLTVEVPYITTYEGYNQRIFLDNRGTTAAGYTTTFTTENGVTAAGGTAATGTLAAGEMATVRVADLVTFTGGTRGSAMMEVEASTTNLQITTQIVDLGTGMTDTIILHP